MRAARILYPITSVFLAFSVVGCATEDTGGGSETAKAQPITVVPADAGAPAVIPPSAITVAPPTGTHLDGALGYQPRGHVPKATKGKTIELVLRSTPPGAIASIDGKEIGVTPTFWSGYGGHRARNFTFVKEGHTMARYRFVATHSGVVHGTLAKLQTSEEAEKASAKVH